MSRHPQQSDFKDWLLREEDEIDELKLNEGDLTLYKAGSPRFSANFPRDGITSAFLFNDPIMLRDQLLYCAEHQGKEQNKTTGEEPGKIFHEMPDQKIRGLSTKFNACDTTALFIIGHKVFKDLVSDHTHHIGKAVEYIESHLEDGMFQEDPKLAGAKKYALKNTYWKDSVIHGRTYGQPDYPCAYTLAHAQNLCAIRCAADVLKSKKLEQLAEQMLGALYDLFNDNAMPYIAVDQKGPIEGISSDMLHMLFYLKRGDLGKKEIEGLVEAAGNIETPLGYRTLDPAIKTERSYHSETVWPFEQALIHIAANKHRSKPMGEMALRVRRALGTNHEMVSFRGGRPTKGGCKKQLWTLAAKKYFENPKLTLSNLMQL